MILEFLFFFLLFQKMVKNGSVGRWETKHFMGMALINQEKKKQLHKNKTLKKDNNNVLREKKK